MTNTIKNTYKGSSTEDLISSLRLKNELFFKYPCELLISQIDKISCELVDRGFTWEQVENM